MQNLCEKIKGYHVQGFKKLPAIRDILQHVLEAVCVFKE